MDQRLIVLAVLVALAIGFRVLMRVLAFLIGRGVCRAGLGWVGRRAMAQQPDRIHLVSCPRHAWTNAAAMVTLAAPLPALGFEDAGVYSIAEMEGTYVSLFVQQEQRVGACLYEHPRAGNWIDFFSGDRDYSGVTYSTARPTGLAHRPGCTIVNAPESTVEALYQRMLRERPAQEWSELTPAGVVERFEEAYARTMAWRRNCGVSAEEVARHIQQGPVTMHTPRPSTE